MIYSEIHIWGDSIARGILYNEVRKRYSISPHQFAQALQDTYQCEVINHAVMGATARDGLDSFERFAPKPGALCVISFGGNDCDPCWKDMSERPEEGVKAKVPLKQYVDILSKFVGAIRSGGMIPLIATPLPLCAKRYFNWVARGLNADNILRALGDVEHIYRWQERYSIAAREVAYRTGCHLFDARDAFLALPRCERLLCVDGIHPNDEGYDAITHFVSNAAKSHLASA